jgi:hypothetical protein
MFFAIQSKIDDHIFTKHGGDSGQGNQVGGHHHSGNDMAQSRMSVSFCLSSG